MGIRDQGLGLNFNQGFGSRPGPVVNTGGGGGMGANNDLILERMRQDGNNKRAGDGNALQRYLNDSGNANNLGINRESNSSRERIAGMDQATRQAGYASAERQSETAANATMYAPRLQQERFNTVMPYFTDALSGLKTDGAFGYKGGGQVGSQPQIDAAPVYSQQQINQQVNSQRAQADARGATEARGVRQSMAGRGFGAGSPLAMALEGAAMGRAMNQGSNNERETRIGMASANSEQLLKGQTSQEQQFANRQSEDIERNKAYTGSLAAILGSIGNLI